MIMGRRATGQRNAARPDEPADDELLRRHLAGDPEAFGLMFTRHRDRLWAVALRTTCDPEEAADALQEAMISAFRRAGDFRGDSAVTTWLHRIVVNACLDRLRRRAARPVAAAGDEGVLEALSPQAAADPADTSGLRLDVEKALRLLPDHQRAALVLVDMLGYPVADAAQILGTTVGTVKSRCARGRARLAPLLIHLSGNPGAAGDVSPERDVSEPKAAAPPGLTSDERGGKAAHRRRPEVSEREKGET
jgi:RNA polymerase sigma-70 factor (ECF subfamily)